MIFPLLKIVLLVPPLITGSTSKVTPSWPGSPLGPCTPASPLDPFSIDIRLILLSLLSDMTILVVTRLSGSFSCVITRYLSGCISSSTLTILIRHRFHNHFAYLCYN